MENDPRTKAVREALRAALLESGTGFDQEDGDILINTDSNTSVDIDAITRRILDALDAASS